MRKHELEKAFAAEQSAHTAAIARARVAESRAAASESAAEVLREELHRARVEVSNLNSLLLERADRATRTALDLARAPKDQYLQDAEAPKEQDEWPEGFWSSDGLDYIEKAPPTVGTQNPFSMPVTTWSSD